jgi:protocatechuate 3,4-dioxygenase beta subunit
MGVVPEATRERLISRFSLEATVPAYEFDIVLRGRDATRFEDVDHEDEP